MNFGKALAVFIQINSDKYSDKEKALAIYYVMKAPTHMSIKKDNMLNVIKWLWNNLYEIRVADAENATTTKINKNSLPEDTRQTIFDSFMKGVEG